MTDNATSTITPTEFAELVGSDPKTVRRFLRSKFDRVGRGGRWDIATDAVDQLAEAFGARQAKSRTITLADLEEVDEADAEIDELDDLGDEDDEDDEEA